ncbi:hypothetical protein BT96DRAFT_297258 [Gymnopus androsaceus JB14]|uniref:C2H2-type domain-containing protein n=1 Tax=Gymnopus androsaceus JB14 TaxID=1447944 RepID=A0A6A4H0J7_9AGAR|nr:hypothetical protein BT96DRAFT_297258 [Gymnopus androsaceus JB14]
MDDSKDASADGSDTRPSNESEGNLAQQNHDTSESAISPPQSENSPEKSIIAEKFASEKSTRMSPRRPVTRSSIKRPIREENSLNSSTRSVHDSDPHAVEPTPASKKQKIAPATRTRNTRKSAATLESSMDSETPATNPISASSSHSPPPVAGSSSSTSLPDPPPPTTPSAAPPIATRIGTTRAMRATLPTPVPNLTKKSRGRRVPVRVITTTGAEIITNPAPVGSEPATDTSTGNGAVSKEKRSYVCSVEGCGKCFHRGEHLKRHIRSIHTHEKPFKCTYPECDKNFNRHDNLLQHLKVHKQAQATAAMTASRSSAVLLSNGKGKSKAKSKGQPSCEGFPDAHRSTSS